MRKITQENFIDLMSMAECVVCVTVKNIPDKVSEAGNNPIVSSRWTCGKLCGIHHFGSKHQLHFTNGNILELTREDIYIQDEENDVVSINWIPGAEKKWLSYHLEF